MKNLYVFGDSFSADYPWIPKAERNWSYHKIIANELNLKYNNFSAIGSGLEYTFEQFEIHREFINNDDLVIICLTSLDRTYFFPDKPYIKDIQSINKDSNLDTNEIDALKYYTGYLGKHHAKKMLFHLINFLHSVNDLSSQMEHKILILDGCVYARDTELYNHVTNDRFKNLAIPNGIMTEISAYEATSYDLIRAINNRDGGDGRLNHLCKINHEVLANKILNFYLNNNIFDLISGFHERIFSSLDYYELSYQWSSKWPVDFDD